MQETYQPATIAFLIEAGGTATLQEIHDHLEERRMQRDNQARERTLNETREKPGEVLESHSVIEEVPNGYRLRDYGTFTDLQRTELVRLCEERITEWIAATEG